MTDAPILDCYALCPQCGPVRHVDSEECCRTCGALAVGDGIAIVCEQMRQLRDENNRLRSVILAMYEAQRTIQRAADLIASAAVACREEPPR